MRRVFIDEDPMKGHNICFDEKNENFIPELFSAIYIYIFFCKKKNIDLVEKSFY